MVYRPAKLNRVAKRQNYPLELLLIYLLMQILLVFTGLVVEGGRKLAQKHYGHPPSVTKYLDLRLYEKLVSSDSVKVGASVDT